jgi:hypothetical protein
LRHPGFLQKLLDIRLEQDARGRLPAARRACFDEDAVAHLAGGRKALSVLEAVVTAPKPPIVWLSWSTKRRAGCRSMAKRRFFNSRSIAFLPRGGVKAIGSRKMSMSSEKRWIRFQPLVCVRRIASLTAMV